MNDLVNSSYLRLSFVPKLNGEEDGNSVDRWTVQKIRESIKNQIVEKIKENEGLKLPPVRVLAHQLFVSKNTIQEVYEELKSEGLIESRPRQGLYVVIPEHYQDVLKRETAIKKNEEIPLGRLSFHATHENNIQSDQNKGLINLSQINIDPRLIPKKLLSKCLGSISKTHSFPHFVDPQGYLPLRETIAKRLNLRGIKASHDDIIITNGTQEAIDLFSRLLPLDNKKIGIEDPTYHAGEKLLRFNNVNLVKLPLNPFTGINLDLWEEKISKENPSFLYLTPNFQNPTGYSYTTEEMRRVIDLSIKYNFGIIEDDWGADILSYSEYRPGFRALGGENVLYTNSFTKKLLPSLRIGYLVANKSSINDFIAARSVSSVGPSSVVEILLFEFLERGFYDNHLKALHKELDQRYNSTIKNLANLMPNFVKFSYPGGGPRIWLNFPKDYDLRKLQEKLERDGVAISLDDGILNHQELSLHGFPVGHAFLTEDEMEKGLKILAKRLY